MQVPLISSHNFFSFLIIPIEMLAPTIQYFPKAVHSFALMMRVLNLLVLVPGRVLVVHLVALVEAHVIRRHIKNSPKSKITTRWAQEFLRLFNVTKQNHWYLHTGWPVVETAIANICKTKTATYGSWYNRLTLTEFVSGNFQFLKTNSKKLCLNNRF